MPKVQGPNDRVSTPHIVVTADKFKDYEYLLEPGATLSNTYQQRSNTFIIFFNNLDTNAAQRLVDVATAEMQETRQRLTDELQTLLKRRLTERDQKQIKFSFLLNTLEFSGELEVEVRRARLQRAIEKHGGGKTIALASASPEVPRSEDGGPHGV